jgi:diacylglycerol kinase
MEEPTSHDMALAEPVAHDFAAIQHFWIEETLAGSLMTQPPVKLRPHSVAVEPPAISKADRRRSPWRRRLVEAERGLTEGFRADSTLFVHFFAGTLVMTTAVVLGISRIEWGMLILSFAMVLSAELFHLAMRAIFRHLGPQLSEPMQTARRMATAGVFFTLAGTLAIVLLIFIPRLWDMLHGN